MSMTGETAIAYDFREMIQKKHQSSISAPFLRLSLSPGYQLFSRKYGLPVHWMTFC